MSPYALTFSPHLPWPVLAGFAALAFALVAFGLFLRRPGTLPRAAGLALLLLALGDPSLVREDRAPLKDVAAIVVDDSGSQTIGERPEQTRKAAEALKASLEALGDVEVRTIRAGREGTGAADGTRLFAALNEGLADTPPERVGAVFLITDGVVHDAPADASGLGFRAPVHALITGHEGERDRRVELLEAPRFGIVGKDLSIEFRVLDTAGSREPVAVRIRRDGVPVATLAARPGERMRAPVRIDHGGANVVEIEVEAAPDELSTVNNKAVLSIDGVRDKLKVLLVSGEPHQGERMWRNLLKSDANVDLVHFTILRPPEKQDGTPINELSLIAFPTADLFGRKIREFDLIVFDRYSNQSVLPLVYFDNIVRYVREGGALLLAAGPDFSGAEGLYFSPLGRIAPARPDGDLTERPFRAVVSKDGERHPVTRGLDGAQTSPPGWGQWFRQVNAQTTRGLSVLNGADDKPLLVLSREGKGRVGLLLSDQMWLWARGFEGGGPHLDLLRRLAHWLMKEPELEEEALRASARGATIEIERQSLRPETPPVTATSPTGVERSVTLRPAEPGLSRASFDAPEQGLWRVSDGTLSALVNVGPENPREFQELVSTLDRLRPVAEASGGSVRRIGQGASGDIVLPRLAAMRESPVYAGADYAAIRRNGASEVRGAGATPLALGFLGLAFLLAGVVAPWLQEGRRARG
ncbi:hypothetical protein [Methylocella sp.]|uniref:hypothetical protein n=1 Tax=Methylocella sp. TaxID=1978226 RepID=UPI0037850084